MPSSYGMNQMYAMELRETRSSLGLSQTEVANLIGASKAVYQNMECSKFQYVDDDVADRILDVLGVDMYPIRRSLNFKGPDLCGVRFGRLIAVYPVIERGQSRKWMCICDCGKEKAISAKHLTDGTTRSCGCLSSDITRVRSSTQDGMSKTQIYNVWKCMRRRCYEKTNASYSYYGGRGIKVCDEWRDTEDGFRNFYEWAMTNGYKTGLSIDRIDVNGNYTPENCMWATAKQQANNRRRTTYITLNGETHSASEWASITGINYATIKNRYRKGFPPEKILSKTSLRKEVV